VHGVELRGLDDQQRRRRVVKEEVLVRLVQLPQVLRVRAERGVLRRALPLARTTEHDVGGGLEIDHQIRRRDVAGEQLVEPLVDEQLVVVEVQVRVDLVFLEQVVRDRTLREQIGLPQADLLPVPVEQEEELRLQGRTRPIGVEVRQKGILRLLEHGGHVKACAQTLGQGRLPHTRRAFNRDVAEVQDDRSIATRATRGQGEARRGAIMRRTAVARIERGLGVRRDAAGDRP